MMFRRFGEIDRAGFAAEFSHEKSGSSPAPGTGKGDPTLRR